MVIRIRHEKVAKSGILLDFRFTRRGRESLSEFLPDSAEIINSDREED